MICEYVSSIRGFTSIELMLIHAQFHMKYFAGLEEVCGERMMSMPRSCYGGEKSSFFCGAPGDKDRGRVLLVLSALAYGS